MDMLVWIGAAVTLAGVAGLGWCGLAASRARRRAADDAALRVELQKILAYNLAALGIAALGLMSVVIGLVLG